LLLKRIILIVTVIYFTIYGVFYRIEMFIDWSIWHAAEWYSINYIEITPDDVIELCLKTEDYIDSIIYII